MKKLTLLSLAAITLAANPIPALCQGWNVELLGSMVYFWETAEAVAVWGGYAYVYTGDTGLSILDISDPADPNEENIWPIPWSPNAIVISGNYMYAAAGDSGLQVIDVSNPLDPCEVGWCNLLGAGQLAVSGDFVYVTHSEGFSVINISDPLNPIEVGLCDTTVIGNVTVSGDFAFLTNSYRGLYVIDVSDPSNPYVTGHLPTGGFYVYFSTVAISGEYAYISSSTRYGWCSLLLVDISDPSNPIEISNYMFGGDSEVAGPITLNESHIYYYSPYTMFAPSHLYIIDIADPITPFTAGVYQAHNWILDFVYLNEYIYTTEATGSIHSFRIVDVSNPYLPMETGSYIPDGSIKDAVIINDYAYLCGVSSTAANDPETFWVVDVSDPTSPFELGSLPTSSAAQGLAVNGDYAYVAYGEAGLWVIDVSDPANPVEVGSIGAVDCTMGVTFSGNLLYVADEGLRIIIAADPTNPVEVGYCYTSSATRDVAVSGAYAYLTDYNSGLFVINTGNITNPLVAGTWTLPSASEHANCVDLSGDYAYVTTQVEFPPGGGYLRIIDVSDPHNPSEVGSYSMAQAKGISVSGEFAFVATSTGLKVLNVSDPTDPYEVGYYITPGSAKVIAVSGDLAYAADSYSFGIFDCADAITQTLTVNLTPEPNTYIPAGGGSFDFNIAVENHTSEPLEFDLWTVIDLPGIGEVEALNIQDITIAADTTIDRDRRQEVPGSAPAGTYIYYAYIGDYPWYAIHFDSFTFTKGYPGQVGSLGSSSDWPCTGEAFDNLMTEAELEIPSDIILLGAYPNPLNATTTISFELPSVEFVHLAIYNVSGCLITELINGWRNMGVHEVTFDGSGLVSGVYVYRIEAGEFTAVRKMVLMK